MSLKDNDKWLLSQYSRRYSNLKFGRLARRSAHSLFVERGSRKSRSSSVTDSPLRESLNFDNRIVGSSTTFSTGLAPAKSSQPIQNKSSEKVDYSVARKDVRSYGEDEMSLREAHSLGLVEQNAQVQQLVRKVLRTQRSKSQNVPQTSLKTKMKQRFRKMLCKLSSRIRGRMFTPSSPRSGESMNSMSIAKHNVQTQRKTVSDNAQHAVHHTGARLDIILSFDSKDKRQEMNEALDRQCPAVHSERDSLSSEQQIAQSSKSRAVAGKQYRQKSRSSCCSLIDCAARAYNSLARSQNLYAHLRRIESPARLQGEIARSVGSSRAHRDTISFLVQYEAHKARKSSRAAGVDPLKKEPTVSRSAIQAAASTSHQIQASIDAQDKAHKPSMQSPINPNEYARGGSKGDDGSKADVSEEELLLIGNGCYNMPCDVQVELSDVADYKTVGEQELEQSLEQGSIVFTATKESISNKITRITGLKAVAEPSTPFKDPSPNRESHWVESGKSLERQTPTPTHLMSFEEAHEQYQVRPSQERNERPKHIPSRQDSGTAAGSQNWTVEAAKRMTQSNSQSIPQMFRVPHQDPIEHCVTEGAHKKWEPFKKIKTSEDRKLKRCSSVDSIPRRIKTGGGEGHKIEIGGHRQRANTDYGASTVHEQMTVAETFAVSILMQNLAHQANLELAKSQGPTRIQMLAAKAPGHRPEDPSSTVVLHTAVSGVETQSESQAQLELSGLSVSEATAGQIVASGLGKDGLPGRSQHVRGTSSQTRFPVKASPQNSCAPTRSRRHCDSPSRTPQVSSDMHIIQGRNPFEFPPKDTITLMNPVEHPPAPSHEHSDRSRLLKEEYKVAITQRQAKRDGLHPTFQHRHAESKGLIPLLLRGPSEGEGVRNDYECEDVSRGIASGDIGTTCDTGRQFLVDQCIDGSSAAVIHPPKHSEVRDEVDRDFEDFPAISGGLQLATTTQIRPQLIRYHSAGAASETRNQVAPSPSNHRASRSFQHADHAGTRTPQPSVKFSIHPGAVGRQDRLDQAFQNPRRASRRSFGGSKPEPLHLQSESSKVQVQNLQYDSSEVSEVPRISASEPSRTPRVLESSPESRVPRLIVDPGQTLPSSRLPTIYSVPDIPLSGHSSPSSPCKSVFPCPSIDFSERHLPHSLEVDLTAIMDNRLQVRSADKSLVKSKAIEDARQMQAAVIEMCNKAGKDPPKYVLTELIGKGSFGRVYKSKDMTSAAIVSVKIIDIDESDTLNPRLADTYSEFLKEITALQVLSEQKARNINHIIEALPVGPAMWMVTEYCGGGSVATLMKPTAPNGIQEKWIIPILREVAEGLRWVHQAGIIHRDIKCANVLITEEGGVQLCDFGVAGMIENKLDKRSTVIGTPHWMAPELFGNTPSYGKEVDIWAFGSMVFELATGLPPNVGLAASFDEFRERHQNAAPRLEGGSYSNDLRDMVAFCLQDLPSQRPSIEQVQRHPYIFNTIVRYPTSSLSDLVRAFVLWEQHGGIRKSLFNPGGAQGLADSSLVQVQDDEWNFSTTQDFDPAIRNNDLAQEMVVDAYGSRVQFADEPPRAKGSRRRPPPQALAAPPAPLVKVFDPNTKSNYHDNSRAHYGLQMPPPTSDLPLRDDSAKTAIKDTMIDLDGLDLDSGLSSFREDTLKPGGRHLDDEDEFMTSHDFSRPALSDPADAKPNRRTQDWKFPTASAMPPPASADPELSRFPSTYGVPRPAVTPGSGSRPALMHHPTEPLGVSFGGMLGSSQAAPERRSMAESLIDLDMSMPDSYPEVTRPSTANSDVGSTTSEQMTYANPFEFERHVSYQAPVDQTEPSIYVDDTTLTKGPNMRSQQGRDITDASDLSSVSEPVSEAESDSAKDDFSQFDVSGYSDSEYVSMAPTARPLDLSIPNSSSKPKQHYTVAHFPELPEPPSAAALMGTASPEEMAAEYHRALGSLIGQLSAFHDVYVSDDVVSRRNSKRK